MKKIKIVIIAHDPWLYCPHPLKIATVLEGLVRPEWERGDGVRGGYYMVHGIRP